MVDLFVSDGSLVVSAAPEADELSVNFPEGDLSPAPEADCFIAGDDSSNIDDILANRPSEQMFQASIALIDEVLGPGSSAVASPQSTQTMITDSYLQLSDEPPESPLPPLNANATPSSTSTRCYFSASAPSQRAPRTKGAGSGTLKGRVSKQKPKVKSTKSLALVEPNGEPAANGIALNGMLANAMVPNGVAQNNAQNGTTLNTMAHNPIALNTMAQYGMPPVGIPNGMAQNGMAQNGVPSNGVTPKAKAKAQKAKAPKTKEPKAKAPKTIEKAPKTIEKAPKTQAKAPKTLAKAPKAKAKTSKAKAKAPTANAKAPKANATNGVVPIGLVPNEKATNGIVPNGMVPNGMVANGMVADGMMANDMVVNDMVANGMVANGMVANGMVANGYAMATNGMVANCMAPNSPVASPVASGTVADGYDMVANGYDMVANGMGSNGMVANGMGSNGMVANGIVQNRMAQNGMTQSGMAPNSREPNGMSPNGKAPKPKAQNGKSPKPKASNGKPPKPKAANGKVPKAKEPKAKAPKPPKAPKTKAPRAKAQQPKLTIAKRRNGKKPASAESIPDLISDAELLALKPKKERKQAKFEAPEPSRFCHVCSRTPKNVRLLVCSKINEGICRKVVCERCFVDYEYGDYDIAMNSGNWRCPHCRKICPKRAQCKTYSKINDKLRATRLKQPKPPRKQKKDKNSGCKQASVEENPAEEEGSLVLRVAPAEECEQDFCVVTAGSSLSADVAGPSSSADVAGPSSSADVAGPSSTGAEDVQVYDPYPGYTCASAPVDEATMDGHEVPNSAIAPILVSYGGTEALNSSPFMNIDVDVPGAVEAQGAVAPPDDPLCQPMIPDAQDEPAGNTYPWEFMPPQ